MFHDFSVLSISPFFSSSAAGGDLHRHCIEGDVTRTEKEICYLIRQITEAVRYLHDQSIVHLDLKVILVTTLPVTYASIFRTLPNVNDGAFCKNSQCLLAVNYFRKTFYLRCLTGSEILLYCLLEYCGTVKEMKLYGNFF